MWKDESKNESDIFTPKNVQSMCKFERLIAWDPLYEKYCHRGVRSRESIKWNIDERECVYQSPQL